MINLVRVAVMDQNGRFLLFHFMDAKKWGLPGGRVDSGETPRHAAMRELKGEVGLVGPARAFIPMGRQKSGKHTFHTFFVSFELLRRVRLPRRPVIWSDGSKIKKMEKWESRYRE